MKEKKSISVIKKGMNRDSSIGQLKNTEYVLAINANTNNETGEGFNIQNEPSNYLGYNFQDYKVIGFRNDNVIERTYFLLTNPQTRKSSIGYIDNTISDIVNTEVETICEGCVNGNILGESLENITQTASLSYVELFNDDCLIDNGGEGLNFDINFPAKKIEIKQEKLGTTLYWNDNRNGKRYLNVSDISYLFTQEIPCSDSIIVDCPLINKLLVFSKHNKIKLEADSLQVGGNLKQGTYEYYACYCDLLGNEITQYSTPINPISIFDENNNVASQTQTDIYTNFAIKIKVKNLDSINFKYYKLVCVERNNVNNEQTSFIAGIYSTTDDTVIYASSGSESDNFITKGNVSIKKRIDFNKINLTKPFYDKAESTMVSGGRLWSKGLTKREEINLQPVVNLFGALALDWQSTIAYKDLYKSAIATSKYKAYMRDEVQPFALRFFYKDGDYSATFPIVGRPSSAIDLETVVGDNVESINATNNNCINIERTQRWQIENTATLYEERCEDIEGGVTINEIEEKTCLIENVAVLPTNSTTIEIDENFIDFKTYVNNNFDDIINPTSDLYIAEMATELSDTYPTEHCQPNFQGNCTDTTLVSSRNEIGEINYIIPIGDALEVGNYYIIKTLAVGDDFSNVGFIKKGEYFKATATTPTTWLNTVVEIKDVVLIESIFPTDYDSSPSPEYCTIYAQGTNEGITVDPRANPEVDGFSYMPCGQYLVLREDTNQNISINNADSVQHLTANSYSGTISYYNDYDISSNIADLVTDKDTIAVSANYTNKIHKKALWFSVDNTREKYITEVVPQKLLQRVRDNVSDGQDVRLSFYLKKSSTTPFFVTVVNLTVGAKYLMTKNKALGGYDIEEEDGTITNYPSLKTSTFYIAVDCKIVTENSSLKTPTSCTSTGTPAYRIAVTDGCYSLVTRDIEYTEAKINWQTLGINKIETYESDCQYTIPKISECEPKSYKKGKFAFWQSTEKYPDNKQLYDSSNLRVTPGDLVLLSERKAVDFIDYYTDNTIDINGAYVHKENPSNPLKKVTDLTCEPIRIPKFPSNDIIPFMYDNNGIQKNADTLIFPLGVTVDPTVIRTMLNVALSNNIITQQEFDNIEGFEILRGDNTIHKSVIANGLGFDMYNYNKPSNGEKWWYSNFPFNDLGEDKFNAIDSRRENLIQHPFNGDSNYMYSFLSPDLLLNKPSIPTEVYLSGYLQGSAQQRVEEVKDFPKYTILGKSGRNLASTLAIAEVALEGIIKTAELTSRQWFTVGTSSGTSLGLVGAGIAAAGFAFQAFAKVGQYRYEWLRTFRDLGASHNFSHMTVGLATYNKFLKSENKDLRALTVRKYIKDGDYSTVDKLDAKTVNINNYQREHSVLFSVGEQFKINYQSDYKNFDNNKVNSKSSKIIASNVGCENGSTSLRDVASPYFTMKNYIPDQWGTIDSIKWLTTNHSFKLDEDSSCETIFGGTVVISPFSWRRKTPIFRNTAKNSADKLPFNYSNYNNIGYPKYYLDYEVNDEPIRFGIFSFPDITNKFKFDCETGASGFYVKPPSKFYTSSHGIVEFLVESEINCHFRYARKQPNEQFYPQVTNISDWVQEKNLPISEPNTFFYNNTYSFPVSNTPYKFLDYTYDKEIWRKRNIQPNAVIYSEEDNNENSLTDPWLVYKPLNWYEYSTAHGKLIDIKDIESRQFLARFENGLILNNAIDNLADRITPQNKELGTAGLFAERPLEFKTTDLGFAGTQHSEICSTPYGHFFADSKRGRIFQIDQNGKNLEVISEQVGNQPTNMKQWFREHLPFKILRYLPEINIDNKFKGIGMNIWYDDRNSRIFFTKRDYILQPGINKNDFFYEKDTQKLFYQEEEIFFDDVNVFKDVSWTIAYKPTEGGWSSYYTFYPDYSPFHNNFFQVGFNWGADKETIWNHTMSNSSFQVFQGHLNPFIVEYPIANENVHKQLNSISLGVETRRYQDNWDFSVWKDKGFNKLSIYNNTKHSGVLNLFPQKKLIDNRKYPKTNSDGTQDILFTSFEDKQNINYFFNRVTNQQNNIPILNKDENNIIKEVNPKAVSFSGKRTLERMVGDTFIVSLENNQESRFNIILKDSINDEIVTE